MDIQATEQCITIIAKGKTVASHARKHRARFTTLSAHMPERHRKHQSPQRLLNWAQDLGPDVHWIGTIPIGES